MENTVASAPRSPVANARRLGRIWPWVAAIASGLLLTLCFAPWEQSWLCWLALTPLLAALWSAGPGGVSAPQELGALPSPRRAFLSWVPRQPWARGFALGYVAGLVFFWCAFYWLWEVTGPGWFLLAPYMGLYFAVWGAFMATVGRPRGGPRQTAAAWRSRQLLAPAAEADQAVPFLWSRWNLLSALLGACAWVGLEWMRSWMLSGFGWNDIGVGLHANLPLIQIAEWTGVGGVSFVAVVVNVIAVATVRRFLAEIRLHRVRPHFDFTLTLALVMGVFAFGVRTLQALRLGAARPGTSIPLQVAAVQANIAQSAKWDAAEQDAIFKVYRDLSDTAIATRPQLLLWPEAATPKGVFGDRDNYRFVVDIAARADCNFLLGTLDYDFGADGRDQADYNAAVLLPKAGGDAQVYRKIHLVPFGEYVPYRHEFPPLAWAVGGQVPGDFAAGKEPGVFETADPAVRLGPLICFEDTIGQIARQPVLRGAQLLVNVTNDAWFGKTAAGEQQFNESVFRPVENRRPLVRCANTGVTAFIDSEGRATQILRMPDGTVFGAGVLSGEVAVPVNAPLTFYTRHGELFSIVCAELAALAVLLETWRGLRGKELRERARGNSPARARDELQSVP